MLFGSDYFAQTGGLLSVLQVAVDLILFFVNLFLGDMAL